VAARELHKAKDAGEVHVDQRPPVFLGVFGGGRAANDPGVVDENIDGAEVLDGFVDEARADGRISYVADERDGLDADCVELLLGGFGS
jgi:hypothetical protein